MGWRSLTVSADGNIVYSYHHNFQSQSTPNSCQNGWPDAYANVTFGFNHIASNLTFVITSTLDQASSDEAWGICNFTITPTQNSVTSDGQQMVIKQESISTTPTIWFSCSDPQDDYSWRYSPSFSTINCAGTGYTYLGPYGTGETVTSQILSVSEHSGIVISLKLAWIDSWDGEAFTVSADSAVVYSQHHNFQSQSTPNTCQNGWPDDYANVTFGFNHTASNLTLVITSTLDQASSDEAWGICDFTVTASNYNVNSDGSEITTESITSTPTTWFSCSGPVSDAAWTYTPAYSTITCAGTGYSYLGPSGTGESVTSPTLTLSSHQGIVVSLQLAWIDSWDGEAFTVTADDNLVYSQHHNFQSQSTQNSCQNGWPDDYETITFGFNHTANNLTLVITSTLDQDSSDEGWGICDLSITSSELNVYSNGTVMSCYIKTTVTAVTTIVGGSHNGEVLSSSAGSEKHNHGKSKYKRAL